jgi:hypothetical protein
MIDAELVREDHGSIPYYDQWRVSDPGSGGANFLTKINS